MGSLGNNDEDEIKQVRSASNVDIGDTEAQDFDSQFSPPSLSGEKFEGGEDADELQFIQSTLPFDDTVPVEDLFETQLLNVCGETQVLDDPDCIDNLSTQLIDEFDTEVVIDSDGEGTDRTEVLDDSDLLSDDEDSLRRAGSHLADGEKMQCASPSQQNGKEYIEAIDALPDKQHTAGPNISATELLGEGTPGPRCGSVGRGFTSIRAASLRASGLAAHGVALKQRVAGNDEIFIRRALAEVGCGINQERDFGNMTEKVTGLGSERKSRIGSLAVRKLFTEDTPAENEELVHVVDANCGANLHEPSVCNNELAGLNYVDSQEPGEASQANALEFVDRLIQVNVVDLNEEVHHGKSTRGKSNPASCAKGPQSLAKRASIRSMVEETGIFDFNDNQEDEGGGDLLCRRKEDLFEGRFKGRKFFTQPRKSKHVALKGSSVDECRNVKKQSVSNKIMGRVHSDSKVVLENSKDNDKTVPDTERTIRKNLINELNEELNLNSSAGRLEAMGTGVDAAGMLDIGVDTQLAAEAMEALSYGVRADSHDNQGTQNTYKWGAKKGVYSMKVPSRKRAQPSDAGVLTRSGKKIKQTSASLSKEFSISPHKGSKKFRRQLDTKLDKSKQKRTKLKAGQQTATNWNGNTDSDTELDKSKRKKAKLNAQLQTATNQSGNTDEMPLKVIRQGQEGVKNAPNDFGEENTDVQEDFGASTPIAHRTRQHRMVDNFRSAENVPDDFREENVDLIDVVSFKKNKKSRVMEGAKARKRSSNVCSNPPGELEIVRKCLPAHQPRDVQYVKSNGSKQSDPKSTVVTDIFGIDSLSYPRGRRTRRTLAGPPPVEQEENYQSRTRQGRSKGDVESKCLQSGPKRKGITDSVASAEGAKKNASLEVSPRGTCKPSDSACTTPGSCMTPVNAASPICMGNEYLKQSCKRNLSRSLLIKEINSLSASSLEPTSALKNSRRRRDMTSFRVLFSRHLGDDIIKQQKKILTRLGVSTASSISDATHFVTDHFVRTRNMLEAIAHGKPVVTHLWLESCGQASCFIDEKNYILRDAKKEKDFGFSMPASLARACHHPLLEGQRVLITPKTKPGKEIIASLVKAVHGQVVERIGRSDLKDDGIPDDLLVLSCEEDYALCVPFLERGATVYSSELLLNGIVTQKLDYERHRLFVDCVRRTRRSTIWLKKDGNQLYPVAKTQVKSFH